MSKSHKLFAFVFSALLATGVAAGLYGQSGIFDRTGIIPGHGSYTSIPTESVDLFSGNLTLRYLDIFLPGPNGLNVEVWRVYNSKVLKDRQNGQAASVQAEHKSWVGIGWTMHMGRVYDYSSNNPVIEFADGRRETVYPDNYGTGKHITREFLKYDKTANKLYFKIGVVWTFGLTTTVYCGDGTSKPTRMVTKIENPYGHFLSISYKYNLPSYLPTISKITDSMGREITFVSSSGSYPKLQQIKVKNYLGNEVFYSYSVGTFSNGHYKLQSFTPPGLPATTYEYYDGSNSRYELTKVTTGYGGVMEFSHANHDFYFNTIRLDSKAVVQKKITFNPGEQATWNFTYPSYNGVTYGTATVQGPEYNAAFTHHAYDASCPWKIGLIKEWSYGDGSASEAYDWTFQEISSQNWTVLGTNMGTAKGPLLSAVMENNLGDSSLKTEYLYDRTDTKKYGLPTRVNGYVNGAANPKSYTELAYFYETSTGFRDKYMFAFVAAETQRAGSGAMLKRAVTSYFQETGKWGAVDEVKRYVTESTCYTWDYDYTCSDPKSVKITIDPPGETGTREVYYSYGIENQVVYSDGVPRYTRVISQYDSSVESEKNQHDGTLAYSYDSAGRISKIVGTDLNETNMTWRPNGENKVVITRGGNTVTKYWDGMGREMGHTETGAGTTLHYRRILDAEGRLKEESAGSTDPAHRYAYLINNAGRVTRITDPTQKATNILYSGIRKTVTDPEQRSTSYDYNDLPGLPTKTTDALGREAVHTYDALGRLVGVVFNGARTHSYEYDWLDRAKSESHPETGDMTYSYNDELKLAQKIWGNARQEYYYDQGGRLSTLKTYKSGVLEETISYGYDSKGRFGSVSGSSGWSRANITYNPWGSVMGETVAIAGLAPKSLSYTYDNNNNQSVITYPDGKSAATGYNTLDMPQSITFNGKSIVDSASYGPNKMPTGISVAGNGTSYSAAYSSSGLLNTMSLTKGGPTLFDASYTYDGAGNITAITSTAPSPALNATFGYDPLNRLTSAAYSTGRVSNYTYEYDAYGNMLTVRENGAAVFNKTFDNQNRITGFSYDERGNLLSSGANNYYWDSLSRLRYIQNTSGEVLGKYTYDDRGLRLKAVPPLPEINVRQGSTNIPDGGTFGFKIVVQEDKTFTVENLGDANLTLSEVVISGQDASSFEVIQQPASPVTPQSSTTFIIRFKPNSGGLKIAALSFSNNDLDENPYNITLYGNYEPEINIMEAPDGGSYDFGTLTIGDFRRVTFTIQNLGTASLNLTGFPPVEITGPNSESFSVEQQPASLIPAGGSSTFTVQFNPMTEGPITAYVSIANDDSDENPYDITLYGAGAIGPAKIAKNKSLIDVTLPDGKERLQAGSLQTITWSGGEDARSVRIEYSTDNGSTYRTIAERAPNDGRLDWVVPHDLSSSCLVRVSDAEGRPVLTPDVVTFEFSFKVSSPQELFSPVPGFSVHLDVPDFRLQSRGSLALEFVPDELRSQVYIAVNDFWAAPRAYDVFLERWHRVKVQFDLDSRLASIWMDNEILLESVSLDIGPITASYGTISVSSNAQAKSRIWIEDVEVKMRGPQPVIQDGDPQPAADWIRLFLDDFENYRRDGELLRQGGWVNLLKSNDQDRSESDIEKTASPLAQLLSAYWASRSEKAEKADFAVDDEESMSGLQSLRMEKMENNITQMTKIFSLPLKAPFGVSEKSFAVVSRLADAGEGREVHRVKREDSGDNTYVPSGNRRSSTNLASTGKLPTGIPAQGRPVSGGGEIRTLSVGLTGTYYIYSFDGRLLAEYNGVGICTRDYIYMGAKLIAEYRSLENTYYYYASDQINSTRIVTDDTGAVVYAATHDPYGGIQKTWVSAYDPSLKFSGKERDTESGLDYFGARYYDKSLYRFLSVDPAIPAGKAASNPQRWNLYAYCGNNPMTYVDPDGATYILFCKHEQLLYIYTSNHVLWGVYSASNNPSGNYAFPNGSWTFQKWNEHPNANSWDEIDSLGFIRFDFRGYDVFKNYGLHSGRDMKFDLALRWYWRHGTEGCIRAERNALMALFLLHFILGDPITHIIVFDTYDSTVTASHLTGEEIKKIQRQAERDAWSIMSFFDFMMDSFFTYGPIPPSAR